LSTTKAAAGCGRGAPARFHVIVRRNIDRPALFQPISSSPGTAGPSAPTRNVRSSLKLYLKKRSRTCDPVIVYDEGGSEKPEIGCQRSFGSMMTNPERQYSIVGPETTNDPFVIPDEQKRAT
jgi:hypothetical protein